MLKKEFPEKQRDGWDIKPTSGSRDQDGAITVGEEKVQEPKISNKERSIKALEGTRRRS